MVLSTSITKEDYKMYSVIDKNNWVVNVIFAIDLEDCKSTISGDGYSYIEMTSEIGQGYFPGYWDGNKFIRGDSDELLSLRSN
jgi:hypothetical protein